MVRPGGLGKGSALLCYCSISHPAFAVSPMWRQKLLQGRLDGSDQGEKLRVEREREEETLLALGVWGERKEEGGGGVGSFSYGASGPPTGSGVDRYSPHAKGEA